MKFKLQYQNSNNGRLGCITDIEKFPNSKIETPAVFFYTKAGSIPHITHEVLELITKDFACMNYPLANIIHCSDAVQRFKRGISEFVGLSEYISFCSLPDMLDRKVRPDILRKNSMCVWSRNGKVDLKAEKYMDIMESFQPDIYVALNDTNTNLDSTSKRCNSSVERTIYLTKQCFARHLKSKVLKNKAIIGAVGGGNCIHAREKSAKFFTESDVDGFLISGLFSGEADSKSIDYTTFKRPIKCSLSHLPEHKLRIISGCWNPFSVLQLVRIGVDVFDTSLPTKLAEEGVAFNFPFDYSPLVQDVDKFEDDSVTNNDYGLNMDDDVFTEQFVPLVEGCTCLVCKKFTRSYIHHLWNAKEMLVHVLLSIHNIHHYLEFFNGIREFLRNHYQEAS